jgi:serine/threonine protein phosphatase PrpC
MLHNRSKNQQQFRSSPFEAGAAAAEAQEFPPPQNSGDDYTYSDEFIVLACDGVWDTMSDRQCAALADSVLTGQRPQMSADQQAAESKGGGTGAGTRAQDAENAAMALAQYAFTSPCTNDDITAIVLTLRSGLKHE